MVPEVEGAVRVSVVGTGVRPQEESARKDMTNARKKAVFFMVK